MTGEIAIQSRPELLWIEENRGAIDELQGTLGMRLHGLTSSQREVIERSLSACADGSPEAL